MVEKYAIWQRTRQNSYMFSEFNESSLFMLCFLLDDGLGSKTYIEFLQNRERKTFTGNMVLLLKHNNMVTVTIDQAAESGLIDFVTTVENLLTIIQKWHYYVDHLVDTIKITLKNDNLKILGTQKDKIVYCRQKILFSLEETHKRYSLITCEGETSYLMAYFLVALWPKDIDHYIQWTLNTHEHSTLMFSSTLEKKNGFVFIGLKMGESDVGAHYKISIANFVELLKKCQMFQQIGEPKIIVHEKDGNVVVDPYKNV